MGASKSLMTPDTFLAHNAHINRSINHSPLYMLCGREPRLPHDTVYNIVRLPPTDKEIEALQKCHLKCVYNLEKFRKEANAEGHELLERIAKEQEQGYLERGLAIGDQLMTRNGYILQNLYNGERLRRYHPPNGDTSLWYASADLQRRDAYQRMRTRAA